MLPLPLSLLAAAAECCVLPLAAANRDQLDVVRWLISKGAALERMDSDGRTAASQAASRGLHPQHRVETLRVLLEAGVSTSTYF
jgi:ankyrin repeat protein